MEDMSIHMAEDDRDMDAARRLCGEWLDWHWKNYADDWPIEGNPMEPAAFQKIVQEIQNIHARPRGGILLARLGDRPVGTVKYREAEPGVAEFHRFFVNEAGRGHGLGRALLLRMFEEMIADGYRKVCFSSARFLTHAYALYQSVGFVEIPPPEGFPDQWRSFVYFMERPLVPDMAR